MPFELGIPSHDTFSEVFARLDSVQFYAALQSWTTGIAGSLKGRTVAFDGKTLRGVVRPGFGEIGVALGLGVGLRPETVFGPEIRRGQIE